MPIAAGCFQKLSLDLKSARNLEKNIRYLSLGAIVIFSLKKLEVSSVFRPNYSSRSRLNAKWRNDRKRRKKKWDWLRSRREV